MNNLFALEPEMIQLIQQEVPDLNLVASFSVLAAATDPRQYNPACYVLPVITNDTNEARADDHSLVELISTQDWQVLITVNSVIDPEDYETTAKTAGEYIAQVRAALLAWDVPNDLGGMLHPQGILEPIHMRDFVQFPMFFRQYIKTRLVAA